MHVLTLGTLDLTSDAYSVAAFDVSQPGRVRLGLDIVGDNERDVIDKWRLIRTQLNQASRAAEPASGLTRVTLTVQPTETSRVVQFVVTGGTAPPPTLAGAGIVEFQEGHWLSGVLVELECLPYALGAPIEYGPFAVTGAEPTFHITGIPGDLPALAELRFTDQSDGVVVNRLRWACRSLDSLDDGDFAPVLPFVEADGDNADADTFTGFYESLTGGSNWQAISSVTQEANQYTGGVFDVWTRVRDATGSLGVPTNLEATATAGISRLQSAEVFYLAESSVSVSLPSDTQDGNFLVLMVGSTLSSVNTPTGWTAGPTVGTAPTAACFYIADADSISAGTNVTVTFNSLTSGSVWLAEYSGVAASSPADVFATNTNTNTTTGTTGTTGTMTQNHGLGLTLFRTESSADAGTNNKPVITTSGWTNASLNTRGFVVGERVISAGGTHEVTATNGNPLDWANLVVVFKGSETEPASLPAGAYEVKVASIDADGRVSAASDSASVTLTTAGAIYATWSAGGGPVVDNRLFWKRSTDDYEYIDTGSAATNYRLATESGSTVEDPPVVSTITPAAFRARIGLASGTTDDIITNALYASLANGQWEPLYVGRTHLPPSDTPLAATSPGYRIAIDGRADTNVALDVDAVLLMPATEQQMDARYTAGDLASLREWVVGTSVDLRSYGFLRDGDGAEAGRVMTIGRALLGPGDTTVVLLPTVQGGVWNVEDVAGEVMVIVRPRYEWLAGGI